jgi:hypothetical protein
MLRGGRRRCHVLKFSDWLTLIDNAGSVRNPRASYHDPSPSRSPVRGIDQSSISDHVCRCNYHDDFERRCSAAENSANHLDELQLFKIKPEGFDDTIPRVLRSPSHG